MSLMISCSVRDPMILAAAVVFASFSTPQPSVVLSSPFCTAEQPLVACIAAAVGDTRCFLRGGEEPPPSSVFAQDASLAAQEAFVLNCFSTWRWGGEGGEEERTGWRYEG